MNAVVMNCETVGVSGNRRLPARVTIVNEEGGTALDCYVQPTETVTNYGTVNKAKLENGRPIATVRREVAKLLKDKILVGHSLRFDLAALNMSHPECDTRDLAKDPRLMEKSLNSLVREYLTWSVQEDVHNSYGDAKACMELYKILNRDSGE